jgi:class 3 adenylate cyclase
MGEVTPPVHCAACNAEVPPGFRFCGHCGASVNKTPAAPVLPIGPTTRSGQYDAERRQLTVVFCDLAESTRLAERLDLDDLRDVVRAYQEAAVTVIERHGGHVAQYLGDGILAYFGYPEAREDDARRAVRASLEVVRSVELLNSQIDPRLGITLGVRVAAHTGLVVTGEVGSGSRHEDLALGPTPNIAARLQEAATLGTAVIGDSTYRLVRGFFECEPLGERPLKGRAEPMPVYRVLRETGAKTLFDVAVARGLSVAVGRTNELELLDADFERAASGAGCAVLIRGEPGIGKSRLIRLFRERRGGSAAWVTFRCSSDDRNSALRPVIHVTERAFRFAPGDAPDVKLKKLIDGVAAYGNLPTDAVPLLAALLGIPVGDAYPPLNLGATLQRVRTQEVLLSLVLDSKAGRPVVLVVEDAHWADPSTVELLAMTSARLAQRRVLVLATARPEFMPSWLAASSFSILGVDRLGPREVEALATSVAGGKALPAELLHQLASKADGVPLYVEEMTKLVLESDLLELRDGRYALREPLRALAIPATLHGSLLARLDRLGPAKGVAQLASVIGREFSLEMLRSVSPLTEPELDAEIAQLIDAGLFDPPDDGHGNFRFRHALTQDAAYQSLLKNTRRRYHQSIAVTFAERFPEMRREQPELFGAHYAAAGMPREAVACLRDAIAHAMRLGNAVEGAAHCREAIALLQSEPPSKERNRLELALQVQLGDALSILQTYASADAAAAFERARLLADDSQEISSERFGIMSGLYRFHWLRGETAAARAVTDELLTTSSRLGPVERVIATYSDAFMRWSLADFRAGLPLMEAGLAEDLAAWGPPEEGRAPASTGLSGSIAQGVQVRCTLRYASALNLTHMGDADRAIGLTSQSIAMARLHSQTYSEAMAYYSRALIHYMRRDPVATLPDAMNCVKIAREHGHFWAALGSVLVGWAQAHAAGAPQGAWPAASLALIEGGLGGYRRAGARAGETVYLTLLAEVHLAGGDQARARHYLDESLASVKATGEVMWLPEIHRQSAAQARARGDAAESRDELRRGAEVARAQGNVLMQDWLRRDLERFA